MPDTAATTAPATALPAATIDLRARDHWQAIDLGCALAREHYGTLLAAWLVFALPVVLLSIAIAEPWPVLATVLPWWLKPLYERLPLLWLSRAVFGDRLPVGHLLRSDWRAPFRGLLRALTWGRFSPSRSLDAPVDLLERPPDRHVRRPRVGLLHRGAGEAVWLTLLGMHVEIALVLTLAALLFLLTPGEAVERIVRDAPDMLDLLSESAWLSDVLAIVVYALVAPFYVAGGFAIYLNRRCQLEGWDLEIGFRRLASRLNGATTAAAMVAIVVVATVAAPADSLAADGGAATSASAGIDREAAARDEVRAVIAEVLAGEDFHSRHTTGHLEFPWEFERSDDALPILEWLGKWIAGTSAIMGEAFRWLLWVALIALVVFVAFRYRHWVGDLVRSVGGRRAQRPAPIRIGRYDIAPESLPDDPLAAARQAWRDGDRRLALSILYRTSLHVLIARHRIDFRESDTEGECVARVWRSQPAARGAFFADLTAAWQRLAYGHRPPDEASFVAIADRFREHLHR